MMLTILLAMLINILIIISTHPVMMMCAILMQILMVCVIMWMFIKSSWFSLILFLIFLGGLMVLFIYIVSLASNEKFFNFISNWMKMTSIATFSFFMLLTMTFSENQSYFFSKNFMNFVEMIFSEKMTFTTVLIMFYLLYTLIVAVKISSKTEGPMRSFIK